MPVRYADYNFFFFARIVKVKKFVAFFFKITIVQKINESCLNEHKYLLMAGWENGD